MVLEGQLHSAKYNGSNKELAIWLGLQLQILFLATQFHASVTPGESCPSQSVSWPCQAFNWLPPTMPFISLVDLFMPLIQHSYGEPDSTRAIEMKVAPATVRPPTDCSEWEHGHPWILQ